MPTVRPLESTQDGSQQSEKVPTYENVNKTADLSFSCKHSQWNLPQRMKMFHMANIICY